MWATWQTLSRQVKLRQKMMPPPQHQTTCKPQKQYSETCLNVYGQEVSQSYTFRQVIHLSKYCLYCLLGACKIAKNSLSTCCKSRQCEISVNYKPSEKMLLSQPKSPFCCQSHYLLPPFHQFLRFESNLWSLSSWACCIIPLWGVIGHSIISHLPSCQVQYCSCSALERRYAIPDVFTWFWNVPPLQPLPASQSCFVICWPICISHKIPYTIDI